MQNKIREGKLFFKRNLFVWRHKQTEKKMHRGLEWRLHEKGFVSFREYSDEIVKPDSLPSSTWTLQRL